MIPFLHSKVGSQSSAVNLEACHKAAAAGDSDKVAILLGSNPFLLNSTTKDADKFTLMHEAALGGHGALVTYLLAQGGVGMLQVVDAKGMTPVHHAASLASSSVIHGMLNQAGNSARQLLSTPDLKGQLPIHHAALHGRIDIIHLIVQLCGREMLMSQDQDGNIPFHKAASRGCIACIKQLLSEEGNMSLMNFANLSGALPIHAAAANGHVMVVQYLVHKGSINQLTAKDRVGKQVLHFAAGGGHLNVVIYVVSKMGTISLGYTDDAQQTSLFYAAVGGHVNVTQYIVFRAGPNIVLFKDKEGRQAVDIAQEEPKTFLQQVQDWLTKEMELVELENNIDKNINMDLIPGTRQGGLEGIQSQRSMVERLAEAITAGDVDEVRTLIQANPQLLRQMNGYGDVPLMAAAFSGALDVCKVMVQHEGPDLLRMRNDDGETPLHIAVSQDRDDVIRWMIQAGGRGLLHLKTTEGAIPLNYAVMRNSMATASLLLEQDGIEQLESVDVNNVTVVDSANSVVMKSFLTDKLRELKEPKQSPGSHQIQGRRSTSHSILMPPTNFLRQTPVFPEA